MNTRQSMFAVLLLAGVVGYCLAAAPATADATRLDVTCPLDQATFNTSSVTFTLNDTAVITSFVYSPRGCQSYNQTISAGVVTGGAIDGSCFNGNGAVWEVIIALQYGGVFMSSDHLYSLVCQYTASQTINSNTSVVDPLKWVPGQIDNSTNTVRSGIAATEDITLIFLDGVGIPTTSVTLGDQISIQVELTGGLFTGYTIDSLTAYSSNRDLSYNLTTAKCPSSQATGDNIRADVNMTLSGSTPMIKITNQFPAFRFQQDQVVIFEAVVSFCVSGMGCTAGCGGSGRRRRAIRVERQASGQTGGLENSLFVLAQDEAGNRVLVPISAGSNGQSGSGSQPGVTTEGDACVSSTVMYATVGAGGALLLALVALIALLVVARRRVPQKTQ